MSDCKHGNYYKDGGCVKCGEHYIDIIETQQTNIKKLADYIKLTNTTPIDQSEMDEIADLVKGVNLGQ